MAYRLKRHEPLIAGLQRIIREEVSAASALLSRESPRGQDRAIHEARKSVKKIRGILRLVKPEIGKQYTVSNKTASAIGKQLSTFRDASAMVSTVEALQKNFHSTLGQHTLEPVRRALLSRKKADEQTGNVQELLLRLSAEFESLAKQTDLWQLSDTGFASIEPGLRNAFRRGRKAFQSVQEHQRAELFHDWRKRVKDHWYHVRLLEPACKETLTPYQAGLKDLESWLGDDHNLTVLRQKIHTEPAAYGSKEETDLALDLINQHQRELRGKAMEAGLRLYERKPSEVVKQLDQFWHAWHQ